MKKPYNFLEYELIEENKQNNSIFKVVIILFIIVISIIICKFKFTIYDQMILLNDNGSYLIMADIDKINTLSSATKIIINNQEYNFEIFKSDVYSNINGTIYQSIYLNIDNYDSKVKMIKCYFLKEQKTLLNSIIKLITGGKK